MQVASGTKQGLHPGPKTKAHAAKTDRMEHLKNNVKAIIFDMDGTILDTDHVWSQVMDSLLTLCDLTSLEYRAHPVFVEMEGRDYRHSMKLMKDTFPIKEDVAYLESAFISISQKLLAEQLRFMHGFEFFHKQLREAGMPSALATNCEPASLRGIAERMQFSQFFGPHIYCMEHVENKTKPDPAMFLYAASQLGAAPNECIVFEDSYAGFQAAKSAGMRCIAVRNRNNKSFFAEHTHDSIAHYEEAYEALMRVTTKAKE